MKSVERNDEMPGSMPRLEKRQAKHGYPKNNMPRSQTQHGSIDKEVHGGVEVGEVGWLCQRSLEFITHFISYNTNLGPERYHY
jgi:hypothetical protein